MKVLTILAILAPMAGGLTIPLLGADKSVGSLSIDTKGQKYSITKETSILSLDSAINELAKQMESAVKEQVKNHQNDGDLRRIRDDLSSVSSALSERLETLSSLDSDGHLAERIALARSLNNVQRPERVIDDGIDPNNDHTVEELRRLSEALAALSRDKLATVPFFRPSVTTHLGCGGTWTFAKYSDKFVNWREICPPTPPLQDCVKSVGQISAMSVPPSDGSQRFRFKIGTGFFIGKNLVMTNFHVLCDIFAPIAPTGNSRQLPNAGIPIAGDTGAQIDFQAEDCPVSTPVVSKIRSLVYVHPSLDVAIVQIEAPRVALKPLILDGKLPPKANDNYVVTIGFPSQSSETPADERQVATIFFDGQLDTKRISPGALLPSSIVTDPKGYPAILHDCSTIHGSSGSPVVDLRTLSVVAVHYHEDEHDETAQRVGNYAVPISLLSQDPKFQKLGLNVR